MNNCEGKIHVMHLIGSTGLYGAERWILALMRAIDKQRIRSTLINLADVADERSAVVQAAEQRGLDAFDFVTGGKFNPASAFRLAKWARQQKVDVIHGHGFKSDLVGLLAGKLAGCRVMTTPHGWSLEKDRKLQLYETMDRFSFRFMDVVCPLSEALLADTRKWCKRIYLIANGVDIDEVRSAVPFVRTDHGHYVIGYIGRLVASKDVETLLYAVNILCSSGRQVLLRLVGDGERIRDLKQLALELGIADRVDFVGFSANAACFLKGFDCFVLPSLSEGIPRCIMEAMAVSLPVVASDIPGNRNLITDGETGLLFSVGDSRQLANCICYLMDNPNESAAMAERGNSKIEEEYSNIKMAKEYQAVYKTLIIKPL